MKVVISILNLNSPEVSKECIDSVIENTNFDSVELWLTDNGSFDNRTVNVLKEYEKYPFVRTIYHPYNMGFIGANNYVFNNSDSECFLTLNNDTIVCPNWLEILLNAMIEEGLAQVGAWIPGVTCSKLNEGGGGYQIGTREDPDYVEGSCMLVRRDAVLAVGPTLFSEYLTLIYYDDSDLSLRLKQANYKIGLVELDMKHHQCYTTSKKYLIKEDLHGASVRNREVFKSKWSAYIRRKNAGNKILVKRYDGIGDVLWATPLLRALKKAYPIKSIDFLTSSASAPVLNGNPFINMVATNSSSIRESDYGEIINLNLAYENTPTTLLVEAYAGVANIPLESCRPDLIAAADQCESAAGKLGDLNRSPYVVLGVEPSFLWAGRNLPVDKAQAIVDYLTGLGMPVIEVGYKAKSLLKGLALDLRGKLSIGEMAHIIRNGRFFVGTYSSPAVMAMAVNVPAVILFGSMLPEYKIPKEFANVIALTKSDLLCLGCHHYKAGAAGSRANIYCMRQDVREKCMVEFPLSEVYSAVDAMLGMREPLRETAG